ncbi:MAG: YggT family protein [Bacteriovoracaceae bacterium]|nr:YggT family protein [Bacteriovoracaceae bacterium]
MIRALINLYCFLLIVDWILSYLPQFSHHNIVKKINMIAEFSLRPVRKYLPQDLPLDISPLVVVLALKLVQALFTILW